MSTSSSTRSGRRVGMSASASAPPSACTTAYPAPTRCPSATSRFWRLSSTTRTVAARGPSANVTGTRLLPRSGLEERLDDGAEGACVDRLREVTLEPAPQEALAVARHGQRGDGDDGHLGVLGPRARMPDDRLGAAPRDLHVQ